MTDEIRNYRTSLVKMDYDDILAEVRRADRARKEARGTPDADRMKMRHEIARGIARQLRQNGAV